MDKPSGLNMESTMEDVRDLARSITCLLVGSHQTFRPPRGSVNSLNTLYLAPLSLALISRLVECMHLHNSVCPNVI